MSRGLVMASFADSGCARSPFELREERFSDGRIWDISLLVEVVMVDRGACTRILNGELVVPSGFLLPVARWKNRREKEEWNWAKEGREERKQNHKTRRSLAKDE